MLLKVQVTPRRILYADCIEDTPPNKGGYFVVLYYDYEKKEPVTNGEFILPREHFQNGRDTQRILRVINERIKVRGL